MRQPIHAEHTSTATRLCDNCDAPAWTAFGLEREQVGVALCEPCAISLHVALTDEFTDGPGRQFGWS
jgi:hypothetical protein